jgi:Ca2+:H+ antiporter
VLRFLILAGYLAMPLAFASHWLLAKHGPEALRPWEPLITFILSGLSVIPLARLMGEGTANLSQRTGPTWGGLLNATFGNAAEIIIAVIALAKGLTDVVRASLTGSILGNLLLVSGAAMVMGGWKRERQTFSRATAQANSALLAVAVVAMLFPAIFHFSFKLTDVHLAEHEAGVSIGSSVILILVYGAGLLFTLRTHRHVFSKPREEMTHANEPAWSVKQSILALLLASVGVALMAELLVGSVEQVAESLHWNKIFVGVILLAIFGNAAEQSTAVVMALRDDMDTAMSITYQSSLQIALFATPFLVLLSAILFSAGLGHGKRLDLIFSPMEVAAVLLAVGLVIIIGANAETNWFEGVLLLATYAILGITFFYIPTARSEEYDKEAPAAQVAPPAVSTAAPGRGVGT